MNGTYSTGPLPEPPVGPPWAATDSAWKVIENLRYAYITIDLELYMSCFRDDFEFWPIPVQQDSFWGYDIEEQFHQNMFDYVERTDYHGARVAVATKIRTGISCATELFLGRMNLKTLSSI